jgi:hypothetical protein
LPDRRAMLRLPPLFSDHPHLHYHHSRPTMRSTPSPLCPRLRLIPTAACG